MSCQPDPTPTDAKDRRDRFIQLVTQTLNQPLTDVSWTCNNAPVMTVTAEPPPPSLPPAFSPVAAGDGESENVGHSLLAARGRPPAASDGQAAGWPSASLI